MQSVLARFNKSYFEAEPFPHLVIRDAIDGDIYSRLVAALPRWEVITGVKKLSSNERFDLPSGDTLALFQNNPLWTEFIKTHLSQNFLAEVLGLFHPHILKTYPDFAKHAGESNIFLEAQLSLNTPVYQKPSSVITTHVDEPNELFAGLFYMRDPKDRSEGGDLEIYRLKNKKFLFHGKYIDPVFVEKIKTVKYESNALLLFLNSINSIHGVSARSMTANPRWFVNLVGEVRTRLFDLRRYQENRVQRFLRSTSPLLYKASANIKWPKSKK